MELKTTTLTKYKVKSNARYTCQECGSTELIQAHHEIPGDDDSLVVLCAECHSRKHPDLSKKLFFNRRGQPYWFNQSASSLARLCGVHPRTIWRAAKKLEIPYGFLLSDDRELIIKSIKPLSGSLPSHSQRKCDYCKLIWIDKNIPKSCSKCLREFTTEYIKGESTVYY